MTSSIRWRMALGPIARGDDAGTDPRSDADVSRGSHSETFGERLSVLSPTKTRVLSIEFTSRNPDLAAKGANAVAAAYLEFQQDAKRDSARGAAASLAELVTQLRGKQRKPRPAPNNFA